MTETNPALKKTIRTGWWLLAFSLPLGMTLEALHGLKIQVYVGSQLRRELWTLAHAHGNLLGLLCLLFGGIGERLVDHLSDQTKVARWIRFGSILMPLGFFAGGILNTEGDPSFGILLVPLGAIFLLVGLVQAALAKPTTK